MNLYKYASPAMFYPIAGKMIPWFSTAAALLFAAGMFVGFFIAPPDLSEERAAWLRLAFSATIDDTEFVADAVKQKLEPERVKDSYLERYRAGRTPTDAPRDE